MATIDAIDITSLLFQEGSAPGTPASTKWRLYFKTDGAYTKDDAGTEVALGSGGLTLINSTVLGSDQASVSFSSIPSGYAGLMLKAFGDTDGSGETRTIRLQVGNTSIDTGTNYGTLQFDDKVDTVDAVSETQAGDYTGSTFVVVGSWPGAGATGSTPMGQLHLEIIGYANTTWSKLVTAHSTHLNDVSFDRRASAGIWRSTSAIDTIQLVPSAGNFLTGSGFYLYGLAA